MKQFYALLFILLSTACSDTIEGRWVMNDLSVNDMVVETSNEHLSQKIKENLLATSQLTNAKRFVLEFTPDGYVLEVSENSDEPISSEKKTRYLVSGSVVTITTEMNGVEESVIMNYSIKENKLIFETDYTADFRQTYKLLDENIIIEKVKLRTTYSRK